MGRNLLTISIVVLSLLMASASAAEELIQNGGFESGTLAPWERLGQHDYTQEVSDEYSLEGDFSGFVHGTDQLVQAFTPRLGSQLEVFSLAVMTPMWGANVTIEIHYVDDSNPTLVSLFVPSPYQWYAFDLLSHVEQDREANKIVLTGHPGGPSPTYQRTWFDGVTIQNNSPDGDPDDPVDPPDEPDHEVEFIEATAKRVKVKLNLKKPKTRVAVTLLAEELPEGIHPGPVDIRVQFTQGDLTTEFEAAAELVEVPHKKDHIIQLMDESPEKGK
jgi:hypothetical protein